MPARTGITKLLIGLLTILAVACAPLPSGNDPAPEVFVTRFETSAGVFEIEVQRQWSPKAADRFFQLVRQNHFDKGVFYRVVPDFVAQFGGGSVADLRRWERVKIPDEQVLLGNEKGTLSFARSGKETRTTELYINLTDNHRLDTLNYKGVVGFPAFGRVIKGMEVVSALFSGYAEKSAAKLDILYADRQKFFELFPELDTIRKVSIVQ